MGFCIVFVAHFFKKNMNIILTSLDEPFKNEKIHSGDIVIDELKVWSDWRQHSGFIASYQWRSQPNVVRRIEIGNDKVITFKTISEAFNKELNKSSAGATIASLTYKEGRVTLYIKPDTQLFNVRMADEIARALKIKPDRANIGELVDVDKVAFHNVDSIFAACEQAKSNTFINSREAETVLTSAPFNAEVEITSFETPSSPARFHAPVGQLTFSIQDKWGSVLPVKKLFCRLSINDQCLRRKDLPPDTDGNSTA